MKRAWKFIAIILLVGGVVFEEWHRAETIKNHLPPVPLRDPAALPFAVKESNFSDNVDLWGNPWMKTVDADSSYASLTFQNELKPASVEKFQPRLDYKTELPVTMQDRQVNYALFEVGGFTFTLNLKPVYPNAEALMPTRLDAGIGGSFSF